MPDTPANAADEITQLKTRVGALETEVRDLKSAIISMSNGSLEDVETIAEIQRDTYERVKDLECAVFPESVRDIVRVNKIIGATDLGSNDDLDKRRK